MTIVKSVNVQSSKGFSSTLQAFLPALPPNPHHEPRIIYLIKKSKVQKRIPSTPDDREEWKVSGGGKVTLCSLRMFIFIFFYDTIRRCFRTSLQDWVIALPEDPSN